MALIRRVLATSFTAAEIKKIEKLEAVVKEEDLVVEFIPPDYSTPITSLSLRTASGRRYNRTTTPLNLSATRTLCLTGRMVLGTRNGVIRTLSTLGVMYDDNPAYAGGLIVGATTGKLKIMAALDRGRPIWSESQLIGAILAANHDNRFTSINNGMLRSVQRSAASIEMVETYVARV
jgi:hypothetical protein